MKDITAILAQRRLDPSRLKGADKRAPVPAADKAAKAQAALADIIAELKGPDVVDVDAFVASVKDRIDRIAAHVHDAAAQIETAANEAKKQ